MLEDLTIKDFALIDSDYLEFKKGLTVLSGETGAGKSIIIGALSFLLGGKADVNQIRYGKSEASVSGTFLLPPINIGTDLSFSKENVDSLPEDYEPKSAHEWLLIHGIEVENGRVLLRRFIRNSGKTGAWINDTQVTRTELLQFSSFLVDIHGQHEHQSLMKVSEHRKFLDARAGITSEVEVFKNLYSELVEKRKQLQAFNLSEGERQHKLEMLTFAVQEISDAKLKNDEDTLLEEEESRLLSFEKIYTDVDSITETLTSSDGGLIDVLKKIRRDSSHVAELDKSIKNLDERIEAAFYELSDIADEFLSYKQKLVFDPERLLQVQERLSLIYNLKKKYCSSVNVKLSELMDFYEKAKVFVEENSDGNNSKKALESEIKKLEVEVLKKADFLSEKRKNCASVLSKEVDEILANLGMSGTKFTVFIGQKAGSEVEQKCGLYGKDDIEFLISANPGNPPLPLAKIASGGELSRVMLALKTIFAQADRVETLIFDEIDTGIGGEVAVAVGKHLKKLAVNRQIFCITHLASIAVYADNQIKIEKSISGEITSSNVHEITGEERVAEIARMLSGDSDTGESLEHARSLLNKYCGGF